MKARRIAWSIVGLLSLSAAARGGPVTWEFAGVVTNVRDPGNLLGGAVTIGSPFSGSYTFESTTPDAYPQLPDDGAYSGAVSDLHGSVGALGFTLWTNSRADIGVYNNFPPGFDDYAVLGYVIFIGQFTQFGLGMRDSSGNAFQSDALPLDPPPLTLFDSTGFGSPGFSFGDPLERFHVGGVLTQLVPEPGTVTLLLGSLLLVSRRWHRWARRGTSLQSRGAHLMIWLVLGLPCLAPATAGAADCNGNGIDDACELSCSAAGCVPPCGTSADCNHNGIPDECDVPCSVDVVFLIDSSTSIGPPRVNTICSRIEAAFAALGPQVANSEILSLGTLTAPEQCRCCTDYVRHAYCPPVSGDPENLCARFQGCSPTTEEEGDGEDSAPGTAVVAANKQWAHSGRVVVPIIDEGPRCGDHVNDADRDAVTQAKAIVLAHHVRVAPVVLGSNAVEGFDAPDPAVVSLMCDLAGRVLVVDHNHEAQMDLASYLGPVLAFACPNEQMDCNGNGIPDSCDLASGASTDCFAYSTGCGASRETAPDGIPDECQPGPDCNANDIPDPCDLKCGPLGSICGIPGCGTASDCNSNCIPDNCEIDANSTAPGGPFLKSGDTIPIYCR